MLEQKIRQDKNKVSSDTVGAQAPFFVAPNNVLAKKNEEKERREPEVFFVKTAKEAKPVGNNDSKPALVLSPKSPKEDEAFQTSLKRLKRISKKQQKHEPVKNKVAEIGAAAVLPAHKQSIQNNQLAHTNALVAEGNKGKNKKFEAKKFKDKLKENLDELGKQLPSSKSEAKKFKRERPIEKLKKSVNNSVVGEQEKLVGPIAQEAKKKEAPKAEKAVVKKAKALPKKKKSAKPKPLKVNRVIPKPKYDAEISLERESRSIDEYMEANDLKDRQLADSNNEAFLGALKSKQIAQQKAKEVPQEYRSKEKQLLTGARNQASTRNRKALAGMFGKKQEVLTQVLGGQKNTKSQDELEQEKILTQLSLLYNSTKKKVDEKLTSLTKNVSHIFETMTQLAQTMFEWNVEAGLDKIYGWTTLDDKLFGEDTEGIQQLFDEEKAHFISQLNTAIDVIAKLIATELNETIAIIEKGRNDIRVYYEGLGNKQKKLAEDAYQDFSARYDDLESSVRDKENDLATSLAKSYTDKVGKLDETFAKLKEEASKGWIDGAIDAVKGVVETIRKLKQVISDLLSSIRDIIPIIMDAPIDFVRRLFKGLEQGFENFKVNIKKHLLGGFIEWLTGALGPTGITVPEDLFSLKGVFSLVTQVLGLGWDYIRKKAVFLLGEKVVEGLEQTAGIIKIIKEEGISGLWEHIKEKFTDLKETVITSIQDMLITKVIEAGVKWLLSLLIPGAGFVKAIMAIKDIIVFFVESAIALIPAITKAIRALANGNIKMVADAMELGMAKIMGAVIRLLAKLLGLSGLAKKVIGLIEKIRKRIDRAITKLLVKAKKKFVKLLRKGKAKVKKGAKKVLGWLGYKKKVGLNGEKHTMKFKGKKLMLYSTPQPITTYLENLSVAKSLKNKKKRAITLAKEVDFTATRTGDGVKTNASQEKDMVRKLDELGKLLIELVSGGEDILPKDPKWSYSGGEKKTASVKFLSSKTASEGDPPKDDTPESKFVKGHGWVRMHLIAKKLGGPGEPKNWVVAPIKVNSGGAVRGFERMVQELLHKDAYVDSKKRKGEKIMNVVWIEVKVNSLWPPDAAYDNLTGFVEKVTFRAGINYYSKDKKWVKDPSNKVKQDVSIEKPINFEIPSLSSPSFTLLNKVDGDVFTRAFVKRMKKIDWDEKNRTWFDANFAKKILATYKSPKIKEEQMISMKKNKIVDLLADEKVKI